VAGGGRTGPAWPWICHLFVSVYLAPSEPTAPEPESAPAFRKRPGPQWNPPDLNDGITRPAMLLLRWLHLREGVGGDSSTSGPPGRTRSSKSAQCPRSSQADGSCRGIFKSRCVVPRTFLLKHVRDWSYEDLTREVRANLVNPETLITMQEIGTILGYQDRDAEAEQSSFSTYGVAARNGLPVPDDVPEPVYRRGMSLGDAIRAGRRAFPSAGQRRRPGNQRRARLMPATRRL
jgi:hypothetical protein